MRINKPNKFCKLYGIELELERDLLDTEVRLFHIYLRLVDWDIKHKDTFGSTAITIRQLKSMYLPKWSIGKISYVRNSLIQKKWFEKRDEGRIGIREYRVYRAKGFQIAERYLPLIRQGVQISEPSVQSNEKMVSNEKWFPTSVLVMLGTKLRFSGIRYHDST